MPWPLQTLPLDRHVRLPQHGWPGPPQMAQVVPALQMVVGAVHSGPAQQGWPAPPQVPQEELAQVPPTFGQALPEPVQVLFTQQPDAEQALPAQQT